MISPVNAGPNKAGDTSTRPDPNFDLNQNQKIVEPKSADPSYRLQPSSWHIPEPRAQSWSPHQQQPPLFGGAWHPLNLSSLQASRDLFLHPRLGFTSPFLPGMTAGFLPPMLDRFPALPIPSTVSASFPALLQPSPEKQKRKRSPSPDTRTKAAASPTPNRSLKARILSQSPLTVQESPQTEEQKWNPGNTPAAGSNSNGTTAGSSSNGSTVSRNGNSTTSGSNSHTDGSNGSTLGPEKSPFLRSSGNQPGHPAHFNHGSLIQLADGSMKRVEDLVTEDFLRSAENSPDVRIDQSTVVKLESRTSTGSVWITFSVGRSRVQVRVEAAVEHPFYVFHRGWASFSPEMTFSRYELACQPLKVGDVCISLTHKVAMNSPTLLMPPPSMEELPTRESKSSPKQVGFHEFPSVYRINTDSPPNQRELGESSHQALKTEVAEESSKPVQPSQSALETLDTHNS